MYNPVIGQLLKLLAVIVAVIIIFIVIRGK